MSNRLLYILILILISFALYVISVKEKKEEVTITEKVIEIDTTWERPRIFTNGNIVIREAETAIYQASRKREYCCEPNDNYFPESNIKSFIIRFNDSTTYDTVDNTMIITPKYDSSGKRIINRVKQYDSAVPLTIEPTIHDSGTGTRKKLYIEDTIEKPYVEFSPIYSSGPGTHTKKFIVDGTGKAIINDTTKTRKP